VATEPACADPATDIPDKAILVASANVFSFIIFLQYKKYMHPVASPNSPVFLPAFRHWYFVYFIPFFHSFPAFVKQAHNVPRYVSNCLL
jgi:hypothetical protein